MSDPVAVSGDEKESELSQSHTSPRPRVFAEPTLGASASPGRPSMSVPAAGRLPSGMGSAMKPDSIFNMEMGSQSTVQRVPMNGRPIKLAGNQVSLAGSGVRPLPSRPSMGAPGDTIASFPAIEKVVDSQTTDVSFTKASATALLEALSGALIRMAAPENAKVPCVLEIGPGTIEKATSLKLKLAPFVSSDAVEFRDFTTAELQGANKVLECAIIMPSPSSSVNSFGMAMFILIATAAGVAYWVNTSGD
jgi:hypothetical protein